MTHSLKHWQHERDADGIAWLTLNRANSSTNVLSSPVILEFGKLLDELKADPPRGIVIRSAKEGGFIAGADVNEFTQYADESAALELVQRVHGMMNTLETLPFPTVALIHGYCLGGGLELALACRYRVAEDKPATRIGLPEVRLGIHPGFGGTYRTIRTIGAPAALDAMLSGRSMSARAARKLGLVDHAVPERHLTAAARSLILRPPPARQPARWKRWASHRLVRPWLAKYLMRKVAARAPRAHYPAPYALIDLWVSHYDDPPQMLEEEARSVAHLLAGKPAQNLIRVFQLQERLKGIGRAAEYSPRHIHVIGAGIMGGDIAAWCAAQGFTVSLQDTRHEALARSVQRAHQLFKRRQKIPRLVQAAADRLLPDHQGCGLRKADIVIEAIFEDVQAKQDLLRSIEPQLRDHCIIATNTSSIPLEVLGRALRRPGRLVGLHLFNRVAKLPLVEVVHGEQTDTQTMHDAAAFTRGIDRLPLPVKSSPGFLVNRILMPYLIEALKLLDEGVPPTAIDKAALDFGMPMGPIELADSVGLDIALHVAELLSEKMNIEVPETLRKLVNQKHLGKKTNHGFYAFKNGRPVKPSLDKNYVPPADLQDRMILRMINEAVACWREGIVDSAELVDAGVIFGTGFVPFRGGPLHYSRTRGSQQLHQTLDSLRLRHGDRFAADSGWADFESRQ
ncbi:MAG: enoyl-CoA hydratase/isomerase family protein [Pseudomonadota bacterium]|nr:MAG: enoyl-CoA hydratase/isomerase family protein [Pseudomonadota bacterium]